MKAHLVIVVVVLASAGTAEATTKLCLPAVKTAPIVDAPRNPRVVVARRDIDRLDIRDGAPGSERAFRYTVEPIDEYWASVTVTAEPGSIVFVNALADRACRGRRYRIVDAPMASRARLGIEAAAVIEGSDGKRYLEVRSEREQGAAWTRLDWAYDPADLAAGLHGSRYADDQSFLALDGARDHVFIRLVRFAIDGTTSTWSGWIALGPDGEATIGSGRPPAVAPRTGCEVISPRAVPIDPTFYFARWDHARFIAVSSTGVQLPTIVDALDDHNRVRVLADEGTVFQLQPLPRPLTCSPERWLRATRDRSHDEPPVIARGDNGGCAVTVELADRYTWGVFEVVTSRASFDNQVAADVRVTNIGGYERDVPLRVRITPIWEGVRGAAWEGSIAVEPRCAGIHITPAATQRLAARATATDRVCEPDAARSLRAALALLGLGLLALLARRP